MDLDHLLPCHFEKAIFADEKSRFRSQRFLAALEMTTGLDNYFDFDCAWGYTKF